MLYMSSQGIRYKDKMHRAWDSHSELTGASLSHYFPAPAAGGDPHRVKLHRLQKIALGLQWATSPQSIWLASKQSRVSHRTNDRENDVGGAATGPMDKEPTHTGWPSPGRFFFFSPSFGVCVLSRNRPPGSAHGAGHASCIHTGDVAACQTQVMTPALQFSPAARAHHVPSSAGATNPEAASVGNVGLPTTILDNGTP